MIQQQCVVGVKKIAGIYSDALSACLGDDGLILEIKIEKKEERNAGMNIDPAEIKGCHPTGKKVEGYFFLSRITSKPVHMYNIEPLNQKPK